MVTLEDAVIARLSTHGTTFEVLVDPDLTPAFRTGGDVNIRDVLAADKIFKDSKKGEKASEEMMEKIFGTTDALKVAEKIIRKGEIQVTTEQRRKMQEDRRKQIVAIISRRAVDPHSGHPHPPQRIDGALEETKIHVDPFKSAEEQLPEVIDALRPIIPLKFETRRIAVKIPPAHAARSYRVVKGFGKVEKEQWLNDGSWAVVVEIPAGVQPEFFEKLNDMTRGEVETKVL
jgi:ribosome maturation protein SDO1